MKMQPHQMSGRTEAGGSLVQAGLQYLSAFIWVRSWGRLGWASQKHPRIGARIRTGCRSGEVGIQYLPVHTKVGTGGWPDWPRLQHPQYELGLGTGRAVRLQHLPATAEVRAAIPDWTTAPTNTQKTLD